mgnify:CR=1 FL=1
MKISKFRDLTFVDINQNQTIVIACDSSGAIGNKERDLVQVDPELLGNLTAQVVLKEILAIGAEPITIVNTLSVEMNDTGERIVRGIKKAIAPLGLPDAQIITGSTEENFPTCQTGMGITIIGIINKDSWNQPRAKSGSLAVVVGIPKVGYDVLEDKGEILSIEHLIELKNNPNIYEILPVGSKGILFELNEMARTNNLAFCLEDEDDIKLDLNKSAGPATCAIISIDENGYEKLRKTFSIPVNRVGRFI